MTVRNNRENEWVLSTEADADNQPSEYCLFKPRLFDCKKQLLLKSSKKKKKQVEMKGRLKVLSIQKSIKIGTND